ncbi:MAG: hypothetical protein CL610_29650 [Anaerolineaceae bacterium]|nr:hypothetical protein [Anaerolineaceae bacterium]
MNNSRFDMKTIGIIALVIIGAVLLLPRLFNTDSLNEPAPVVNENEPIPGAENIQIGNPVTALSLDRDGCAVDTTSQFSGREPIYVVAPDADIPAGTGVFVRLYQDGNAVEDTTEIRADQDYQNTCLNFVFEPVEMSLDPGTYEAEFYINGNPADTVSFEVQ